MWESRKGQQQEKEKNGLARVHTEEDKKIVYILIGYMSTLFGSVVRSVEKPNLAIIAFA